jgi:hypothetical protein
MSHKIGDWGLRIWDWGSGIADLAFNICWRRLTVAENPQSPIRNFQSAGGFRVRSIRPPFGLFLGTALVALGLCCNSCGRNGEPAAPAIDPQLASHGTIEVTAELVEIPEGAIFKRDLYDYATILKYRVVRVHRGAVDGDTIYVGHYNPWKPRSEAADQRVREVGGSVGRFEAGQRHRMALEEPIEDHFMGGIVNKYFGQTTNTLYWAVWSNEEKP